MNLLLRKFEDKDFETMMSFYDKYGLARMPKDFFSDLGLVVENDEGDAVAFAFIYFTNSRRVYLEDMITNPDAPAADRASAIKMIARASHEGALKNNGRFLIAFTKEQTIEKHATELGWKLIEQPFHCITLGV